MRVLVHHFRACSDEHRDRYHDECPRCLLISSNEENCAEATHVKDAGGRCLTCSLFDARLGDAEQRDIDSILRRIWRSTGGNQKLWRR